MSRRTRTILVVDRESDSTLALVTALRERDLEVIWARDGESAFNVLDERAVDAVIAELQDERIDGLAVLDHTRERHPQASVVIVFEGAPREAVAEALRRGAYDVEARPVNATKMIAVIERALALRTLTERVAAMEASLDERLALERLSGRSRAIRRVVDQVRSIASTRASVLIEGERGTGKSLVAHAIHRNSPRRDERFAWVSLAAIPAETIETELFGHVAGGGGDPGRFELADGGTLLLEDIADAPPAVQFMLLRVLQDRAFERVGGTETLKVDVRVIAATDRDLATEVREGRFREDLYQRMSVVRLVIPPLRERPEDIPALVDAFVQDLNRERGRKITGVTRGVLDRLTLHSWPGNVRELRDTIESMMLFAEGKRALDLADLPGSLRESGGAGCNITVGMTMAEAERILIAATLRHAANDKPRAAAMLGIGLRTLYRKIKQYALR